MIDNKELKTLIKRLVFSDKIVNQADFASKLGYERSTISGMTSGKKPISESFANKVCEIFDVNLDWMRTGDGEMLKDIGNGNALMHTLSGVPLLPISAQGGTLNDFVMSVKDGDCERIISPIKGIDFVMPIAGDSMAPEYPSGSYVHVKKINEHSFIEWGKVYVLDTCNGIVIKEIHEGNEGCVKCVSINPDPKYSPFNICFEDIYGMYKVILCQALK